MKDFGPTGPSTTALGVFGLRAAHQVIDDAPPILADPVALRLLDPGADERIRANADAFRTPGSLGLRAHVLLRSRWAEDLLAEAVARGVHQYAILGAGWDTFAYRQPAWAADLRIVEADLPATQAAKRSRLADAGIVAPPNVGYAALDLVTDDLFACLASAGFDRAEPAVFTLLGVTVYLPPDAVDRLYRTIATSAPGSELVLTFSQPPVPGMPDLLAERAAAAGEPWLSRTTPEDLVRDLRAAGFAAVEVLATEVAARYFVGRQDGLMAPRRASLARAVTGNRPPIHEPLSDDAHGSSPRLHR